MIRQGVQLQQQMQPHSSLLSFICLARLRPTRNYPFSCMVTASSHVQHTIILHN